MLMCCIRKSKLEPETEMNGAITLPTSRVQLLKKKKNVISDGQNMIKSIYKYNLQKFETKCLEPIRVRQNFNKILSIAFKNVQLCLHTNLYSICRSVT